MGHTIDRDQMAKLVQCLDLNSEEDIRPDYSGRYMYGKTCIGFVVEQPMLVMVALTELQTELGLDLDDLWELARDAQIDDMGLSKIVYFPTLQAELEE